MRRVSFFLLLSSCALAQTGEEKQLTTYAFPQLVDDRTAAKTCRQVIAAHRGYTVNFSGRAKARAPVENAVMQVLLNRQLTADGMTERNRSANASYTLFLGHTRGFYANVSTNMFCLFSKTGSVR